MFDINLSLLAVANTHQALATLVSYMGNKIMPLLAGLFFAAAVINSGPRNDGGRYIKIGMAFLMVSGFCRLAEAMVVNNGNGQLHEIIINVVSWVGNVALPIYGAFQVILVVVDYAYQRHYTQYLFTRLTTALGCFLVSGLARLIEGWVIAGKSGFDSSILGK
jgi:hypothetical protein